MRRPEHRRCAFGFTKIELIVYVAILAILAICAVPNRDFGGNRPRVAKARSDMRRMATVLESFHDENGRYPEAIPFDDQLLIGTDQRVTNWRITSFDPGVGKDRPGMTTPIAYLEELPFDEFWIRDKEWKHVPLAYYNDGKGGWILISAGPDGDYDIDASKDYLGTDSGPSESLIQHTYDPSNGAYSDGDIWRVKETIVVAGTQP